MELNSYGRVGPKEPVRGKKAVCASQDPIITDTMLQVMKDGGNAADAMVAGSIAQAVVQAEMTNHTGTVMVMYWDAATAKTYLLNSCGTIVPGLAPFRPVPSGTGVFANPAPFAVIPGFMPGMKAMYERFCTKPWAYLCQPAIRWAEEGNPVNSFAYADLADTVSIFLYTRSGREHFTPNGFLPDVGERFKKPALAKTMKRLAEEGPDYFITGEWAEHFVQRANELGWPIKMEHMTAIPPRWQEPLRYAHREYEIVQSSPPFVQGCFSALVLGILDELDVTSMGHYTESAEALYYVAHALRRAYWDIGTLNDPETFEVATDVLLSKAYHKMHAEILKRSRPKIDLTEHVTLTSGLTALAAAGVQPGKIKPPTGSCEMAVVDPDGNWVQMMNTLQSGGIPGEVVDGVNMVGSHANTNLHSSLSGWFTGGGRMTNPMGSTLVFKGGKPFLSLGTPGNVHCTPAQVLLNILDYGMDPYTAIDMPRMMELEDDYTLAIESRIPESVVAGLAKMGLLIRPLPKYDMHMGSFQMAWRDEKTGLMSSTSDPRRAGNADGF